MAARKWIKNLSAGLLLIVLLGLAALTFVRARRITSRLVGVSPEEDISEALSVSTGFEFIESIDGELIFALSSARTLGMSSGWHEIEGVSLQFFDEGEEGPTLTCEKASFNKQTRDARLSEGIHIDFPDGGFLNTQEGNFDAASTVFETDSRVTFVGEGTIGNAGRARYDLSRQHLQLLDGVLLRTEDGGVLRAPNVTYDRSAQQIWFPDGCQLDLEGSKIDAVRATLVLESVDGPPVEATFLGGVTITSTASDQLGAFEGWSERLHAARDSGGNWQIDASSNGPWVKLVFVAGDTFIRRTLDTWLIRGVLGPAGILNMRAEHSVCFLDVPLQGAPRRGEARAARLWFENGQATDVELEREVVLRGEGVEARGYRARFSATAGVVMLHGNPTGPARALLISDRGQVHCDQVHLYEEEGRSEARGNVQGSLEGVGLLGSPTSAEREPMHFAGELLEVTDGGGTYHLKENARAWQGHRLLLADEVEYRQEGEAIRARGHVRTTLPAQTLDPTADPGEDVVVVARSLDYGRLMREAVYRGNVRYSDPTHILSASELRVTFDDDDEITMIEALGAVEIEDLASGQRVTGQEARRQASSKVVELTGSPAQAIDAKGNVVRGHSLTWDQASGSVTVAGDTETIYYPEETP